MHGKLLVVDDETATLEVLSKYLEFCGYDCDVSEGMESAVEKLGKEEYHVVVTDKNMPSPKESGESGIDLIRYIRRNHPSVGTIVMTGYATVESAVEAMRLGAFDYIQKPFSLEDLKEKVDRIREYQNCLNPEAIMNTYRSLHEQMLDLYEQGDRDTEEKKHEFLKLVQDHMDSVFRMVGNLERMLLFQRERLAAVESHAGQLLEEIGMDDPLRPLAERIARVASRRL